VVGQQQVGKFHSIPLPRARATEYKGIQSRSPGGPTRDSSVAAAQRSRPVPELSSRNRAPPHGDRGVWRRRRARLPVGTRDFGFGSRVFTRKHRARGPARPAPRPRGGWATTATGLVNCGRSRTALGLGLTTWYCPCLFQLFGTSGHQKLLWTAKHSAFQSAFIKFVWLKTIQNQHKHIIG
jgi:hypothetical protein